MRKSTRDEIGNSRDRQEVRAAREANQDKWTAILKSAVQESGFRIEPENNGMMSIIDPDHREVVAHAPIHIPSKRKMESVLERCENAVKLAIH